MRFLRDPFEKPRTIDLARFRNEGCILTASLSPCTERDDYAPAVVSVCPLTVAGRGGVKGGLAGAPRASAPARRGRRQGESGAQVVKAVKVDV